MNFDENDKLELRDNMHQAKLELDSCVKQLRNYIIKTEPALPAKKRAELDIVLEKANSSKYQLDSAYKMLMEYLFPLSSKSDEQEN